MGLPDKLGFGGLVGAGGVTGASIVGGEGGIVSGSGGAGGTSASAGAGGVEVLEIPVQQQVRVPEVWVAHPQGWGIRPEKGAGGRSVISSVSPKERGGANLPKRMDPHLGELGVGVHIVKAWSGVLRRGSRG